MITGVKRQNKEKKKERQSKNDYGTFPIANSEMVAYVTVRTKKNSLSVSYHT